MTQLASTVAWMEIHRLKNRLWALVVLFLLASFGLGKCSGEPSFDLRFENSNQRSSIQLQASPSQGGFSGEDKGELSTVYQLLEMLPIASYYVFSLFWGLLIIVGFPLRGKEEWESGHFQMISRGDFSHLKIGTFRFLFYSMIVLIFLLSLGAVTSLYWQRNSTNMAHNIWNLQILVAYSVLVLTPFLLSLGSLMSAVSTAYYKNGRAKLITFMIYLGAFCFCLIFKDVARWSFKEGNVFLPRVNLIFDIPGLVYRDDNLEFFLSFDLMLISFLITSLFLFSSARILEEVET